MEEPMEEGRQLLLSRLATDLEGEVGDMRRRTFLQLLGLGAGAVCTGQVGQVSMDHVGMGLEEMQDAHDAAVLRYAMTRPGAGFGPRLPRMVRAYGGGLSGVDIVTSRWET